MVKLFNPTADKLIANIQADGGEVKFLNPKKPPPLGKLISFQYSPKFRNNKKILPFFDEFPASIVLFHNSDGWTGLNVHMLPWATRLNLAERLLRATRNKNRITYGKIRKALKGLQLPIAFSNFIIRRYLASHIISKKVAVFDFDNYLEYLKNTQPEFVRKSDATIWRIVQGQFYDYAKAQQKKPKWTNVKRR